MIPYGKDKNCPNAAEIRAIWKQQAALYSQTRARLGRSFASRNDRIVQLYRGEGRTAHEIAPLFDLTPSAVYNIVHRRGVRKSA